MNETDFAYIFGVVLSLLFTWFPGLKTWYAGLPSGWRGPVMAIASVVVAAGMFVGSCYAIFTTSVTCDVNSGFDFLVLAIKVGLGTVGTYSLLTYRSEEKLKLGLEQKALAMKRTEQG